MSCKDGENLFIIEAAFGKLSDLEMNVRLVYSKLSSGVSWGHGRTHSGVRA